MDLVALFNQVPFAELLGIELTAAEGGRATGELTHHTGVLSNPDGEVIHGGATCALADSVGGAAVISLSRDVSPTVDFRIDYLAPATTDIRAEADVLRHGGNLATVRVDVTDETGAAVAVAHGTYKTAGAGEETPWSAGGAIGGE